ncbi:TBC1 domain, member 5 [Pichia californica]|nr:TBC1 domain, member 5 [[Candida] californica]
MTNDNSDVIFSCGLDERVFNQAQRSYNNNLNTCLKYTSHAQIERMKNYSNHFYNNNNNNNNNNSNNNSNNHNRNFNLNLNLNYNDNSVPQQLMITRITAYDLEIIIYDGLKNFIILEFMMLIDKIQIMQQQLLFYEDVRDNFEEMDVDELNNKILKIYANPNLGIEEKKSVHSMCYVDIRLKRT